VGITIVGAGIGGLVTALSLEVAGIRDIQIYERAHEIRGLGVGINLLPHAVRELSELGLGDRLNPIGASLGAIVFHNAFGQEIWREKRGTAAGSRWPQLAVHRGLLQLELLAAVRERLGDIVHLGHELVDVQEGEGSCVAHFATGGAQIRVASDVLIGADGIHSRLRALRYPDEGAPIWSGATLWRGTAVVPRLLNGTTMVMAGDAVQRFIAYPIAPDLDGQTQLLNFIAEIRGPGSPTVDWNRRVDPAAVRSLFENWRFPWLDAPAIIDAATEVLEYPMVDRNPLPRWSFGRTTLLGDAAHAMYPVGSNGASQAILDARSLAAELAATTDPVMALNRYEQVRRPATTAVLEANRRGGPEQVMVLAAQRAPEGFDDIDNVIPHAELEQIMASYRQTAGFDVAQLNARASLGAPAE